MIGSPNDVRFVCDGNGDIGPTGPTGPTGSAEIEGVFDSYFAANGLATEPTPRDKTNGAGIRQHTTPRRA